VAVELNVREVGAGLPLLLLHAFPLSSAMWLPQREALSGECRVITPDFRGFGGSPLGSDEPSLDRSADDVAAVLDRLELERVVLGGLSMGGYVAMAFLRRYADRVTGIVLADTRAGADAPAGRDNRLRIADMLDADPESEVLVEDVLPSLVGPTTTASRPLVFGRVRGLVQQAPAAAAAWAQRAMAARPDSHDVLRTVTVPSLVIRGAEDPLSSADDVAAMAEALTDSELVEIPRAGHLSSVEAPDEFADAMRALLRRCGSG